LRARLLDYPKAAAIIKTTRAAVAAGINQVDNEESQVAHLEESAFLFYFLVSVGAGR
jgi:hypothetical protein